MPPGTWYGEAIPLKNITSEGITKTSIEHIFLKHGVPGIITSDRGMCS